MGGSYATPAHADKGKAFCDAERFSDLIALNIAASAGLLTSEPAASSGIGEGDPINRQQIVRFQRASCR